MAIYSNVKVKLTGKDGNAFVILGTVSAAMEKAGVPQEDISKFLEEAQSGDYNNLLSTCIKYVDVA